MALPRAKQAVAYALVHAQGAVRLVRRPADDSLMPGMWELPRVDGVETSEKPLFTLRHSITVTDYVVSVVSRKDTALRHGRWVDISQLNQIPLTGLAKKILRRAQIIQ